MVFLMVLSDPCVILCRLLLPYECHLKGILMNALPQHQPKDFHYANYSKDDDDCRRPAKRKLLSIQLHQVGYFILKQDKRDEVKFSSTFAETQT